MAFTPLPNSHYYLVAEHSGKVLEVKDASHADGAIIQQNAAKPFAESTHQQFTFNDGGERIYVLRVKHSQKVIDIAGGSKDDRIAVQQYGWHGVDHERFRIIDAGDGCVFLEAVHSGKVLEVYGEEKGDEKPVLQYHNHYSGKNKHQRFRPVLAEEGFAPSSLPGFTSPSQIVRDVTLGITGLIPTAGGAIKGVVGMLWPDAGPSLIWNQVMRYIESYVESRLEEVRITALRNTIEGAKANLRTFVDLVPGTEKATKLVSTITALNQVDRPFFDIHSAERTLSYLVTIGTIKLTLLQEAARYYADIAKQTDDPNKAVHMKELRDGIAEYTRAAKAFRAAAMKARVDRIGRDFRVIPVGREYHDFTHSVTLKDGADGREMQIYSNRNGNTEETKNKLWNIRKALVEAQFGAQLDAILAPSLLWGAFDPDKPRPTSKTVKANVGPWGSVHDPIALADGKGIARIELWADAQLRGIRITNRSAERHMVGAELGTYCGSLDLAADEYIVGVYGSAYYYVHSLFVETNFGRRLGGGNFHQAYRFQADLPPELSARLVDITASGGPKNVDSIRLDWEYALQGEYPVLLTEAVDEGDEAERLADELQ
ncbi:RICIN domain-containing protein [Lysobacter tyrosinilyticus]